MCRERDIIRVLGDNTGDTWLIFVMLLSLLELPHSSTEVYVWQDEVNISIFLMDPIRVLLALQYQTVSQYEEYGERKKVKVSDVETRQDHFSCCLVGSEISGDGETDQCH